MRFFLLGLLACLFAVPAAATHIIGGDIHYEYLGSNQYLITIKIYRDCNPGNAAFDASLPLGIYDTLGNLYTVIDVPLPPTTIIPNNANNPCLVVPPNICVEEAIYTTTVTLPPLAGGYNLVYQRCCRNAGIVNIFDPENTGGTFFAHIPGPFAFENSDPEYNQFPPTVICNNYPFEFDHSAVDQDGDSLVYTLCAPFVGGGPGAGTSYTSATPNPPSPPPYLSVTYIGGYTAINPMGGTVPLSIDPQTGWMTVTPDMTGRFVVGVCVSEYRDGVLLSEHKRDFQFNVTDCTQSVQAITAPSIVNCQNLDITFSNFSVGGISYHWNFGVDGVFDDTSGVFSPTFTYPDTGTYSAALYVNPGTICADTAYITIALYPNLDAYMEAPDGCSGNGIQFSDSSVSTFGAVDSWQWSFGDGSPIATTPNPLHVFNDTGIYAIQLIVTTSLGCIDTAYESIAILTGPINFTIGDTTICKYDAAGIGVDAIGTFTWTPNYEINDTSAVYPLVTPDVTTTYFVTAVSPDGCIETDSVVVIVFDTVFVSVLTPDTTLCPGDSYTMTGDGGIYYSWTPDQYITTGDTTQQIITVTPDESISYTFSTWVGSCYASESVNITVLPYPELELEDNLTICEGDSVQLTPEGLTSYSWTPSEGLSATNIQSPWASPDVTTMYKVTGTDAGSCPIVLFDSVLVQVIENTLDVTAETTIILGTSVQLTAYGAATYEWTPTEGLSAANIPDPVASPTVTTTYTVNVIFPDGCPGQKFIIINVNPEPFIAFPNAFTPNGDGLNDLFRPYYQGLIDVEAFRIYNRWGNVVYEAPSLVGWDGRHNNKDQEVGAYAYYLIGKASATGTPIAFQGNFTLMR
ncbi:MAG TPA: PKD domain-containing protein [Chitinophagales bacterium]|nr:PKD domain-containing protein [Chitinophagales bacterium]